MKIAAPYPEDRSSSDNSASFRWTAAPPEITLAATAVHVWQVHLDLAAEEVYSLAALLSVDERLRAERFKFEQHRRRFIVARGMLRHILGRYLGIDPKTIQFSYGDRGKPSLLSVETEPPMQFNLSHSQGLALYGFARQRIGVDLEYLRSIDCDAIAKRYFSEKEAAQLEILRPELKLSAFYRAWTAKEAYLKAIGAGLAGSLDQIEISLDSTPPKLLAIASEAQALQNWFFMSFQPADNFFATVIVDRQAIFGQLSVTGYRPL